MTSDELLATAFYGLIAGMVCGAVPMVVGAIRSQLRLGLLGFIACAVSGTVLGLLLAIPMCGVFVWLIVRAGRKSQAEIEEQTHKKCPYCAESILADAKVCKFCGRDQPPPPG